MAFNNELEIEARKMALEMSVKINQWRSDSHVKHSDPKDVLKDADIIYN